MRLTWLGWAGVELESGDATLVIDPLGDPAAVFAAFGDRVAGAPLPQVVDASAGRAVAGLVTHLHRDHTDAPALDRALAPGAPIFEPAAGGGGELENLALLQAEAELAATGRERRQFEPWESTTVGPFTVTALPAVDGFGDPQVAWLVEADGVRVLHLGDTLFHGSWWRMARRHGPFDVVLLPVNGTVARFPHRRPASPLPAVLTPEQAAVAAEVLGARLAIPMHSEGYEIDGIYAPVANPSARFKAEAEGRGVARQVLMVGESIDVVPAERVDAAANAAGVAA